MLKWQRSIRMEIFLCGNKKEELIPNSLGISSSFLFRNKIDYNNKPAKVAER